MFQFANTFNVMSSPIPLYTNATTGGNIGTSDIGKVAIITGEKANLYVSPSSDETGEFLAIITEVPSSGIDVSSTVPFYARPIPQGSILFANYTTGTGGSATLPATSDLGKYISFSTAAGLYSAFLSMGTLSTAPSTNYGQFKLLSFDNDRREAKVLYYK
jgi:hypothetical protein